VSAWSGRLRGAGWPDELDAIARHAVSLPLLDPRVADEILGYDADGVPR
jgi:hypothetical protein